MKKISLFLIIYILLILSSCASHTEIHEKSFIISIGLDYYKDTCEYEVSIYFINNANLTQESAIQTDENSAYTASAKAKSLTDAFRKISTNIDVVLEFNHVKTLIINTNFITSENMKYLYTFLKNGPLLYPIFEIYLTNDKIIDLYKVKVFEETTLFYTLLTGYKKSHNHNYITYYDFVNDYLIENYFLNYPIITFNDNIFQNEKDKLISLENIGSVFLKENLEPFYISYSDYPGLYLINDFNDIIFQLNDIELVVNNYTLDVSLDNLHPESVLNIIIKSDVAYIYSDITSNNDFINKTKEYFKTEIDKLFSHCLNNNIDLFNINFQRSLQGLEPVDIKTYKISYTIDLLHP